MRRHLPGSLRIADSGALRMLQERACWTIQCDRCQQDAFETDDYSMYPSASCAVEVLSASDWLITGDGRHYCADCCVWDEARNKRVVRGSFRVHPPADPGPIA
jgi:hypothetical protein